jgi:hypothetical protein
MGDMRNARCAYCLKHHASEEEMRFHVCEPADRRAAPKMGDSPAAPEDGWQRDDYDTVVRALRGSPSGATDHIAAGMIELLWARNRALEGVNAALAARCGKMQAALRTIQHWDCLNPPRPDLLSDLPWLRTVVDAALASQAEGESATPKSGAGG